MPTKKQELAQQNSGELAELDMDLLEGATGFEDTDQDSYAIPFLRPLQKMSPQVDEADGAYVEGAKPGMVYNTVTQELYDGKEGIVIIPCAFQRKFLLWGPRDGEGGLKGTFTPEEVAAMEADGRAVRDAETNKLLKPLEDGSINEKKCDRFTDTRNHFCLLINEESGSIEQVLISLASTQVKKSKALMSMLSNVKVKQAGKLVTPPTFVNRIRMVTIPESNDSGSWHGVKFMRDAEKFVTDNDIATMARDFFNLVRAGDANVDYSKAEGDNAPRSEGF